MHTGKVFTEDAVEASRALAVGGDGVVVTHAAMVTWLVVHAVLHARLTVGPWGRRVN